jgi:hypothetical protein
MNPMQRRIFPFEWFPPRRFAPDFPLSFWFAGLWLYLKAFLYLCYFYMQGIEPPPYSEWVIIETAYFGIAIIPCLILALALWNEKKQAVLPAIAFFLLDTPILLFHVLRLAEAGFLDSGLTKLLEIGSLFLNVVALGWLIGSRAAQATKESSKKRGR